MDDRRKVLEIRKQHYAGKGKPQVISRSLLKAASESVTDYIIHAEVAKYSILKYQREFWAVDSNDPKRFVHVVQALHNTRDTEQ